MTKENVKYAAAGAAAGLANGLFGAGGGLVLVPLLTKWIKLPSKNAFATSVCAILPVCAASAAVYFMSGSIDLPTAAPYLVGGAVGGALSGRLFPHVSAVWLRRAFGAFMLYGAVRLLVFG